MDRPVAAEIPVISHPEWSREDLMACILSALCYLNITAGMALMLLNQWSGYLLTINAVACAAGMYVIIDPKLIRVSEEFEKKQKGYLEELDRIVGWQDDLDRKDKA